MRQRAVRAGWAVALAFAIAGLLGAARPQDATAFKPLDQFTTGFAKKTGLFTLYHDSKTGAIYIAVRADQIGKEFLYVSQVEHGALDVTGSFGHNQDAARGRVLQNRIFKIEHLANQKKQLRFIDEATTYYFDPASPLARAQKANNPPEVFGLAEIVAASADGSVYLVRADTIFGGDSLSRVSREQGRYAGTSRIVEIRNHTSNSDFDIDYLYDVVFDSESPPITITIRVHHSLIELADSDYVPRADDHRVGFLTIQQTDLTSLEPAPYADLITRWNLKKKDPAAPLSEPVKPIVFWIENTTPTELRDAVKKGILAWNTAFEAAGFKNAIRAEVQPDDPDWATGDIHHNVIRWISSPRAGYYGLTWIVTNPRSGEIVNANIVIDYWAFRNNVQDDRLFAATRLTASASAPDTLTRRGLDDLVQRDVTFGLSSLTARSAPQLEVSRMIEEAVAWTVAHEVGHALGLDHNFRATASRPFNELNAADPSKYPLSASLMDYLPVNIARKGQRQGAYFMTDVGPYDIWAIQYGYTPPLADPKAEQDRVKALLARSAEPQLAFASPGDVPDFNRAPDRGIDPRVMQWDLSADPVAWAIDRLQLVQDTTKGLKDQFVKPQQSYQQLVNAFYALRGEKTAAAWVLARHIGGIYVELADAAGPSTRAPFTPVPAAVQKSAMAALRKYVFAPDAFALPPDLVSYLQTQRRGANLTVDPNIHGWALGAQTIVIEQILSPRVLSRVTNSRGYGNTYTVEALLSDLTAAIFAEDENGNVNTLRQGLQAAYVQDLALVFQDARWGRNYDAVARAAILKQLRSIKSAQDTRLLIKWALGLNDETIAHRENLRLMIAQVIDTN